MFHLPYFNQTQKYVSVPTKRALISYHIFYSHCSHQHVSAGIPAIFRVKFNCILLLSSLSCATCPQLIISISIMSFSTPFFPHLVLGLPVGRFCCKFAWYVFLVFIASSIRCGSSIHLRKITLIFDCRSIYKLKSLVLCC